MWMRTAFDLCVPSKAGVLRKRLLARWRTPSGRSYNVTLRAIQVLWSSSPKHFLNFKCKMHEPQFRHAACLIAASIITDVLMMLGRARRTFTPRQSASGRLGSPRLVPAPMQLHNSLQVLLKATARASQIPHT